MIDFALGFMVGVMLGLLFKPKDKDLAEQQKIYDEKCAKYEQDLHYYKKLCKWHVEQKEKK